MKKLNFRKITALAGSLLMTGATLGLASAAAYPAPFVSGGTANVAVVYGTGAGVSSLDLIQAGNIQTDLQSYMEGTSSDSSSEVVGESVQLSRGTANEFNLGENMADFYSSIDEGELPTVLAKGEYLNDNNDAFEFEQKITLSSDFVLEHFKDSDFNDDKPILGFAQASGDTVLTYTLDFTENAEGGTATTASDFPYLETTNLEMLGYKYYVSAADWTSYGVKLTLLDSADSATVSEGETATINGKEASITYISDTEVKLNIDGETTNSLAEGETYKLSDDSYVGIIDILYDAKDTGISKVEFSIGTGKIVLENGQEVELNGEDISSISEYEDNSIIATITNSSQNLDSIVLTWTLEGDAFLAEGDELVLPGFESVKLSMANFVRPSSEMSKFDPDGDDSIKLSTEIDDGSLDLNLVYLDSGSTYIAGLGEKSTHKLVSNKTSGGHVVLNETENSYFVATWIDGESAESFAYELQSIEEGSSHTNKTILKNLASSGSDITFSEVGDDATVGSSMTFNLTASDDDTGIVTIDFSSGSGTVYTDRLVTADGLQILLPVESLNDTIDADIQFVNSTVLASEVTFGLNVTEESRTGTIAGGPSFTVNFTVDSGDGIEVASVGNITTYETEDDSDTYVGYMVSPLATMISHYKPTSGLNDLVVDYAGAESYAEVFIAESDATITTTSGGTSQLGDVLVKDSEVSSVATKNLIVVGGSCINSAAATLVGGAYCGAMFTENTGVGSGQFLIKGYSDSSLTSKMALLVAGYDAADTVNAATYLRNEKPDTSKGYTGTSATSAELIVE